MTQAASERFLTICIRAIEYVGSANYSERERSAKREVYRNYDLAKEGRTSEMRFNPAQWEEEDEESLPRRMD